MNKISSLGGTTTFERNCEVLRNCEIMKKCEIMNETIFMRNLLEIEVPEEISFNMTLKN